MTAVTLALQSIKSIDDSTEANADEPYVIVTAIDFSPQFPQIAVTLYGPWADVDKGEPHGTAVPLPPPLNFTQFNQVLRTPFWGLNHKTPAPVDPEKSLFFITMMENDDGRPDTLASMMAAQGFASAWSTISFPNTKEGRADRIDKIVTDLTGMSGTPTGGPNFDDRVAGTHQFAPSAAALTPNASKRRTVNGPTFSGGNEGTFSTLIEIVFA